MGERTNKTQNVNKCEQDKTMGIRKEDKRIDIFIMCRKITSVFEIGLYRKSPCTELVVPNNELQLVKLLRLRSKDGR